MQTLLPDTQRLTNIFQSAESVCDKMRLLYEHTRLNDVSIRLRFLGALQIQTALSGLFLNAVVYPFGSTVNGFGRLESDLDMILHYNHSDQLINLKPENLNDKRLMFHCKGFEAESDAKKRETIQNHIRCIGSICDLFLPGAVSVFPIYKARIPIVRYNHSFLNTSVDVSLLNMSGLYVSELFHILGELDDRVRPLVFTVRQWAAEKGLTKKKPTSFTNFHITCLAISFLQQLNEPILPSVHELIKQARPEDTRRTEDKENYTFLRDLQQIQFKTTNTSSLEELFLEFLEYFGTFDFAQHMISLRAGKKIRKFEPSPLQIINPFQTDQNWGRTVSFDECMSFRIEAQHTLGKYISILENDSPTNESCELLDIFSRAA